MQTVWGPWPGSSLFQTTVDKIWESKIHKVWLLSPYPIECTALSSKNSVAGKEQFLVPHLLLRESIMQYTCLYQIFRIMFWVCRDAMQPNRLGKAAQFRLSVLCPKGNIFALFFQIAPDSEDMKQIRCNQFFCLIIKFLYPILKIEKETKIPYWAWCPATVLCCDGRCNCTTLTTIPDYFTSPTSTRNNSSIKSRNVMCSRQNPFFANEDSSIVMDIVGALKGDHVWRSTFSVLLLHPIFHKQDEHVITWNEALAWILH